MDLSKIFPGLVTSVKTYSTPVVNTKISSNFNGLEAKAVALRNPSPVSYSRFNEPINKAQNELAGFGRGAGQASSATQKEVMSKIVSYADHLSEQDQALLLSIAKIESGFNPDAAATSTSASGVFQLVRKTAESLGVAKNDVFDADANIKAGIKLFEENINLVNRKYPKLSGNERAVMLYALHHDGPSLAYGGEKIAREKILPELPKFYDAVMSLYSEECSPRIPCTCT